MKKGEKQKMRTITRNPWGSTHTHTHTHRCSKRNVNKEKIDIKTCMLYSSFCVNEELLWSIYVFLLCKKGGKGNEKDKRREAE